MEEIAVEVSSPPTKFELAEGWMLKEAEVREVLLRIEPGAGEKWAEVERRREGTLLTRWTKFSLGSSKLRRSIFPLGENCVTCCGG